MTADTFRAFVAAQTDDGFARAVNEVPVTDLPDGVLVDVSWSSVNYKDALASSPDGRVARISPLIPGIDLAGTLAEDAGHLSAGTAVLAHGYDIGVSRHGGFASLARVPEEWLVPLPTGLDARDAMVIGTAGFTAALSVIALQDHGITPEHGPILVTGATGGVGSSAVNILAGLGYEVVASTGKADAHEYLRSLGAIDIVLRGGSLLGIDSVQTPIERRREVWHRLAGDLRPGLLDSIGTAVSLDDLDGVFDTILRGGVTGRYVVATGS